MVKKLVSQQKIGSTAFHAVTGGFCLGAALLCADSFAVSGDPKDAKYPSRPIRLLVPNAPGSSVDVLSRIFAAKLSEMTGQQVVADNRSGAGGIVGMELAKNAPADGYTVVSATTAASTVAVLLQKTPSFDPLRDFECVLQAAVTANVLVVHPSAAVQSVEDWVNGVKLKSGRVNMASAGSGSQSHLSGAYLMSVAHFSSLHVPYKGGGPSVAAVLSNESQWTLTPAPAVINHLANGKLRALGHSLPVRSALLPGIPAIAETFPGFDYSGWQGFLMPLGTPRSVVEKFRSFVLKSGQLPELKALLAAQATEVVMGSAQDFRHLIEQSIQKNTKVIQSLGLKLEELP